MNQMKLVGITETSLTNLVNRNGHCLAIFKEEPENLLVKKHSLESPAANFSLSPALATILLKGEGLRVFLGQPGFQWIFQR